MPTFMLWFCLSFYFQINFESWEYLISLSGYYGPVEQKGPVVVRSLTIESNGSTYGPYGREEGIPFRLNFHQGLKFGGFHGRCSSSHLSAIGVYVKTIAKYYFRPDPPRCNIKPRLCSASTELPASASASASPFLQWFNLKLRFLVLWSVCMCKYLKSWVTVCEYVLRK